MALDGLRVVDRSATVAGRRLGSLLADQGASVVAERARSLGDPVFDRAKYVVADAAAATPRRSSRHISARRRTGAGMSDQRRSCMKSTGVMPRG